MTLLPSNEQGSEEFSPAAENVVQGFLKVWRCFGQLPSDLINVLFVTLLDFLAKQLAERAVPDALIALLRMIRHQI